MSFVGVRREFSPGLSALALDWLNPIPEPIVRRRKQADIYLWLNAQAFLESFATLSLADLLSRLWPAVKASHLDPEEALRYE